jgi:hypothetical protein
VQGPSELAVLKKLLKNGYKVVTPFSKSYPENTFELLGGFPDLYLPKTKTFIEVKSTWTFSGKGKDFDHLATNQAKAEKYNNKKLRWVVHSVHKKKDYFITLPKDWWQLDFKKLEAKYRNFHKTFHYE